VAPFDAGGWSLLGLKGPVPGCGYWPLSTLSFAVWSLSKLQGGPFQISGKIFKSVRDRTELGLELAFNEALWNSGWERVMSTADDYRERKPSSLPRFLADDPNHWRERGEQMRMLARAISDAKTKKIMLEIAESYDKLADRAALRSNGGDERSQ
jgi:hypothetical protein